MRVLVTGATGFIGRALVPYLVAQDIQVTMLLREAYGMGAPLPEPLAAIRPHVAAVYADLRNLRMTTRAVREAEPEVVIHLAAAGVTNPFLPVDTALRHNLSGTVHLLRACFETGMSVRKCIIARTPGERTVMNVYAASKASAWAFCRMYARTAGWPVCGAMIYQAYGPSQPKNTLIKAALRAALGGADFPMTSGEQERDWIYLDDVLAGLLATIRTPLSPGTTVELGTGEATSLADVVREIYRLVDRGGAPRPGALPDRPGEETSQVADLRGTQALLDWQPVYTLQDGLARMYAALGQ